MNYIFVHLLDKKVFLLCHLFVIYLMTLLVARVIKMAEIGKDTKGGGHNVVKGQSKGQTIIKCIGRSFFFFMCLFWAPLLLLLSLRL